MVWNKRAATGLIMVFGTVVVLLIALAMGPESSGPPAKAVEVPVRFVEIDVQEPSSVAFHPTRNSLLVISDEGELDELDLEFKVLHRHPIPGDLEGVAVHPLTGTVFVASESAGTILEFDLDLKQVIRMIAVDFTTHPAFASGIVRNRGIEGVTVVGKESDLRLFAVVEDGPPRLIELKTDLTQGSTEQARQSSNGTPVQEVAAIVAVHQPDLPLLSDVMYDSSTGRLFLVASKQRLLGVSDLEGKLSGIFKLPGGRPEGFCFLPSGDAVLAQDSGGIHVLSRFRAQFTNSN